MFNMTKLQTILISVFSALFLIILAGFVSMTIFFGLKMSKEIEANRAGIAQIVDFINQGVQASQKAAVQATPDTGAVKK